MKKLLLMAACSFACFYNSSAQVQLVSTLAGQTGTGSANGTGTVATFNQPEGMCVDLSGNVYVADYNNHIIRKITPAGVVTTLAGSAGVTGSVNATGTAATFWHPTDVCADGSGNIYVVDSYNNKIRKITPAGVVSDYAGSGNPGSADGPALSATFVNPEGICCDLSGNLYVADISNQRIRKISTGGVVSTVAGSGAIGGANATGTLATFNYPTDVCVDISGNLYVTDVNNHCIRMITPAGVVSTFAGTLGTSGYADGTGTAAKFDSPSNLCSDASGNIYVADFSNHKVRKITSAGVVTTVAGLGNGYLDGNNTVALFSRPAGVAAYLNGLVYVSDRDNNIIRKIEPCSAPSAPSASNASVCVGQTVALTATSTGSVSWFMASTGGTALATTSSLVISNTFPVGQYTLYAEASDACTVSVSRTPVVVTVSACCVPPAAPTITLVNTAVVGTTSATLIASGTGSITWYNSTGASVGNGTMYITPALAPYTTYTFYAEASTCTVSPRAVITFSVFESVGIPVNQNKAHTVSVYPNPTNGVFVLETAVSIQKMIEVVDVTGRVVLTTTSSDSKTQLNLNAFADGIYYVKVQSGKNTDVIKVVKQ